MNGLNSRISKWIISKARKFLRLESKFIERIASEAPKVVDYFGDIQIERLPSLKSKTIPDKPIWTFSSGTIFAFNHKIYYKACQSCRRKVFEDSKQCSKCGSLAFGLALKATIYIKDDNEEWCEPITFFSEYIQSLLRMKSEPIIDEITITEIHDALLKLQGRKIGFRVKCEQLGRVSDDGQEMVSGVLTVELPILFRK